MDGVIKEPLKENQLLELLSVAKDYALSHGVIVRSKESPLSADVVQHAPFTLFPSPVPRHCFQQAVDVQVNFNLLMHRVAHDRDFLADSLKSVIEVDDFTKHIWDIYETVQAEGVLQPISLAMNRSDYMIDYRPAGPSGSSTCTKFPTRVESPKVALRQVEFNTMAASFAGLSQQLNSYHRYILGQQGLHDKICHIPVNTSADGLAEGIVTAWTHYGNQNAVVLFLVYPVERNMYDHRWLEYSIYDKDSHVRVIRRSLKDVQRNGQLSPDRRLLVDGLEVAVVYQRCCYVPADFQDDDAWRCRLMMERSKAIVCPSAGYHLAGTKKVQQVLAQPGVVERFITDEDAAKRIRATFAAQYSLDMTEEGERNVAMAIGDPCRFVLKPQREGGGNNTYGEEIRTVLTKIKGSKDRSSYILMEKIEPMVVTNYPVTLGQEIQFTEMVSELGIYGTLVGTKDEIFLNKQTGHLLRTKKTGTDEGGVATGYSVLDTPYLEH